MCLICKLLQAYIVPYKALFGTGQGISESPKLSIFEPETLIHFKFAIQSVVSS